jgi:hypothetical protein
LQRRGFWSVVARCATMPRRSDLDDPFGTLTWTSSRSPMETPHSAAAVWWLAYEPRGLICSAAAAICWTPIFVPDRRYRPWNSRWKCRLRKSTSVNPAASASARVNGCEVLRDMPSSLGEFDGTAAVIHSRIRPASSLPCCCPGTPVTFQPRRSPHWSEIQAALRHSATERSAMVGNLRRTEPRPRPRDVPHLGDGADLVIARLVGELSLAESL